MKYNNLSATSCLRVDPLSFNRLVMYKVQKANDSLCWVQENVSSFSMLADYKIPHKKIN